MPGGWDGVHRVQRPCDPHEQYVLREVGGEEGDPGPVASKRLGHVGEAPVLPSAKLPFLPERAFSHSDQRVL